MESNDAHSISMSRTSSQMAQAVVGTPSANRDENLGWIQGQAELEQKSLTGHEGQTNTSESQITFKKKRRRLMRQMQKDIGTTANSYTVVFVLLGSITYLVFLQPPCGLDDNSRMKQKYTFWLKRFVNTVLRAVYFSVAGIVVCISWIAFVLPPSIQYARDMLFAEMNLRGTAVDISSVHEKMLDIEVKSNESTRFPGF